MDTIASLGKPRSLYIFLSLLGMAIYLAFITLYICLFSQFSLHITKQTLLSIYDGSLLLINYDLKFVPIVATTYDIMNSPIT